MWFPYGISLQRVRNGPFVGCGTATLLTGCIADRIDASLLDNSFDIIAVGIEDKRSKVAVVISRPRSWSAVVASLAVMPDTQEPASATCAAHFQKKSVAIAIGSRLRQCGFDFIGGSLPMSVPHKMRAGFPTPFPTF